MWKFCPNCGHALAATWKFCAECGQQVGAFVQPPPYINPLIVPYPYPLSGPYYVPLGWPTITVSGSSETISLGPFSNTSTSISN